MAAQDETMMTLSGVGEAKRIHVETVSAAYFPLLRVKPALGRTSRLTRTPFRRSVRWRSWPTASGGGEFGGDPQIVGRASLLNAQSFTITGVMPAGFRGLSDRADVWIPFVMSDSAEALDERGNRGFQVLARLRTRGGDRAPRRPSSTRFAGASSRRTRTTNEKRGVEVSPLDVELLGNFRPALRLLMVAVAFVLLIACANVANLLLARSEARQREIAVRTAIGAGWARLLRQMITESAVLTAIAAVAGLALAEIALTALVRIAPISFPSFVQPHVNMRVAAFAVAVCTACAMLLGMAPAFHGRVSRLAEALKDSARGSTGRRSQRLRRTLIVAEVALAVVLLVGAGLMIRTVQHLAGDRPRLQPLAGPQRPRQHSPRRDRTRRDAGAARRPRARPPRAGSRVPGRDRREPRLGSAAQRVVECGVLHRGRAAGDERAATATRICSSRVA